MAGSLVKCCNTVAEQHGDAHWVSLSAPMAALPLVEREPAIPCEARLALSADKLTVRGNIMLKEY